MTNIGEFCKIVFNDIKDAIDGFNAENNGLKLAYPSHIDIEHDGVKVSIPFGVNKNTDGE